MIRHKIKQTPQELYWEKKRREEEEKDASLPPGLINHGNTCFMNSTLQGLIATRPLHDLAYFQPVSPSIQSAKGSPILSRRSPQLTNGHGLGGSDEVEWSEGMPLGDIFTTIMRKAWDIQDAKRRETISPKEILTTIGRKYDQYLDFRQQDAHEFLRHMLDAMRMEELDIIKKRQPPQLLPRADGPALSPLSSVTPSDLVLSSPPRSDGEHPLPSEPKVNEGDGEKLESFVDMLFGGQLASILVCEKCKKVSVTHEDFNDLSLSIKPEDYVKDRKRDRIKKIARKLRIRPPSGAQDYLSGNLAAGSSSSKKGMFTGGQRASSVPASPVRRSGEVAPHEVEPPTSVDPRRRSFDHPGEEDEEARDVVKKMVGAGTLGSAIVEDYEREGAVEATRTGVVEADGSLKVDDYDWTRVETDAAGLDEKGREKLGKDKDDPWGKLARRISVSMKIGAKDKEKEKDSRPSSRTSDRGRKPDIKDAFRVMRGEPRSPRNLSLVPGAAAHDPPSDTGEMSDPGRTRGSSPGPVSPRISSPLAQAIRSSNSRRPSTNPFRSNHHDTPTKSPVAPKISEEEMAYLRRILTDVHPVTGSPLSIFQHAFAGSTQNGVTAAGSSAALATQVLWAKLSHLPGIEECLRMFTAVEILDGENMVGCHRCWKIANGLYKPLVRSNGDPFPEDDSDTESEDESDGSEAKSDGSATAAFAAGLPQSATLSNLTSPPGLGGAEDGVTLSSPELSNGQVTSASTPFVSTVMTLPPGRPEDASSVLPAPTSVSVPSSQSSSSSSSLPLYSTKETMSPTRPSTYGGLPIPQISTTEPDTPESVPAGIALSRDVPSQTWSSTRAMVNMSLSDDSLLTPKARRRARKGLKKESSAEDSATSSDEDFDDSASDASAPTSIGSDGSASPFVSPRSSVEKLSDTQLSSSLLSPKLTDGVPLRVQDRKVARSKQTVPRRMYKRYLISTPPPILVIHLKRFQQTNKTHAVSFSSAFKKVDDFVSYPEYLDLAPFLAPKREDFVAEKSKKGAAPKQHERCMYRLYAIVVHIGNMLGGHYVAYTALPPKTVSPAAGAPAPESEKSTSPPPMPPYASRTSHSSDTQRQPRQWAYISDTVVRITTLEEALKAKAYICMYERI